MVLGMHRSGTSLVAQALERLGVVFGNDLIPGNQWNEKGYYEYRPSVDASLQILKKLDRHPFQPSCLSPLPAGWMDMDWVAEVEERLVHQLRNDLQTLSLSSTKPFGLKDPHATLLLPLWERIFHRLDMRFNYVLSIRHPGAVTKSVLRRDRVAPMDVERMWLLYNLSALSHGGEHILKIFDYSAWQEESETIMKTLAEDLDLRIPDTGKDSPFISKLSHADGEEKIWMEPVYKLYQRLLNAEPGRNGWQAFCQEAQFLEQTVGMFSHETNERKLLEPLVPDGQPVDERGILNARRRAVLFPNSSKNLSRLWPPQTSKEFNPIHTENAAVAVIVTEPPDPDTFSPLPRFYAEIISVLVHKGISPIVVELAPDEKSHAIETAINTHWPTGSVSYQYVAPPSVPVGLGPIAVAAKKAYWLYEWLKEHHFDVIHAPDSYGSLYFCLRAKEQGIGFTGTRFIVHPVNGVLQDLLDKYEGIHDIKQLPQVYIEKASLELADRVSLPGRGSLRRLLDAGLELRQNVIDHIPYPYLNPTVDTGFENDDLAKGGAPFKRILCLPGYSRKGIALFCKAMTRGAEDLRVTLKSAKFSVTFVVPEDGQRNLGSYIDELPFASIYSYLVTGVDTKNVLFQLLRNEPDTLCVFPTVNSWNYCQLKELVAIGASVLVADRNMGAEILTADFVEETTCAPLPDSISRKIYNRMNCPAVVARSTAKKGFPASWATPPKVKHLKTDSGAPSPLVTVCVMHFERPQLVDQALSSVENQTYSNFEVVLVDDGSLSLNAMRKLKKLEAKFKKKDWRVVRQPNRYLGAARNSAAMVARGKYLFFLDDDNVLKPYAIEKLVGVAEKTGVDVVASFSDVFRGNHPPDPSTSASLRIIQVGDDLSYGFFRNAFGDSNALIRRSTFLTLGGNSEDYAVGLDDMEFFARTILYGYRLTVVPEALYWARQMPTRLRNLHFNPMAGNIRVCRTYLPHVPVKLRPLFLLISGNIKTTFEGRNVTLRDYRSSLIRRMAETRIGAWLRYSIWRPMLQKFLIRFGLIRN